MLNNINKEQRIVLAVSVLIISLFISYLIAGYWEGSNYREEYKLEFDAAGRVLYEYTGKKKLSIIFGNPFEIRETWYIWITILVSVSYVEMKIFGNTDNENSFKA